MPKVSVVLATHNRAEVLPRAVESVRTQTFKDWELIIINDGSRDSTDQLLKEYSLLDSRITVHDQGRNSGLPSCRAMGVSLAKGEYIAFLDDDDTFSSEKLAAQTAFLDASPDTAMVYSHVRVRGEGHDLPELWPRNPAEDLQTLLKQDVIQPNSVLIRRKFFEDHGNFRTDLPSCDDYELFLRVTMYEKVSFLPVVAGEYWWHGGNMSHHADKRLKSELKIFRLLKKKSAVHKTVIEREVGLRHYRVASDAWDVKEYKKAVQYYYYAVSFNPAVGLDVPWNQNAGKTYRFLRPYLVLLVSFFKFLMPKRSEVAHKLKSRKESEIRCEVSKYE